MFNSFGKNVVVTTFGESHGACIGVVIDGFVSGFEFCKEDIQKELDRRRPGQSEIVTSRKEKDEVEICSGVFDGKTTGAPITMLIANKNQRPKDYDYLKGKFRAGHADYTYLKKYGLHDIRGGGRSSARTTAAQVAAGALMQKFLKEKGVEIFSYVDEVGEVKCDFDGMLSRKLIDSNEVRCPDASAALRMKEVIMKAKEEGDTVGGVVRCVVKGVPTGLGDPVFRKLSALLAQAMFSINAVKGFEMGAGFAATKMKGSEHNDYYEIDGDKVRFLSNNAGGVLGGISNGEDVIFRVAFKPVSTLMKENVGRHDPCVLPRAVPIVDSMAALVLADLMM